MLACYAPQPLKSKQERTADSEEQKLFYERASGNIKPTGGRC